MAHLKRILRYLKGTSHYSITYRNIWEPSIQPERKTYTENNPLELEIYSDSDWAGDLVDRKSQTGYVFKLAGGAILWKSAKQKCVSLSSAEAEFVAMSDAAREAVWMHRVVDELGYGRNGIPLYVDNQTAEELANTTSVSQRTKHIDIRVHFIRQIRGEHIVVPTHVPGVLNTADVLTKPLPRTRHEECCRELGIESSNWAREGGYGHN